MKKKFLQVGLVLAVVFGLIFGFILVRNYYLAQVFANFQPPPVTISATKAVQDSWSKVVPAVGSLLAVNGVEISTQTPGNIESIHFTSGQEVESGDLLIQIDDRTDQADLVSQLAELEFAKVNFEKARTLYAQHALAEISYKEAQTQLRSLKAMVAKTKTMISFKRITAPFAGKVGIRTVNVGEYVVPGAQLVTLQAHDPLNVHFTVPEQFLNDIAIDQVLDIKVDTYPDEVFKGTVTAINTKVDDATRNVLIEGILDNSQGKLLPGMFAEVNVVVGEQPDLIVVPDTAISYNLYGDSVFVVTQDGDRQVVNRQYITVGERHGTKVSITKGLKAGDIVVTSGQLKLQNGMTVEVVED